MKSMNGSTAKSYDKTYSQKLFKEKSFIMIYIDDNISIVTYQITDHK